MKKAVYALGLLALTTVTSCTDNTYDLSKDNVDWSMQTSGDVLWLPDGSTANAMLKDLFSVSEGQNLKFIKDPETGRDFYCMQGDGEQDATVTMPTATATWSGAVTIDETSTTVDLSNIPMENTDAVESMLPYMYNLNRVEMCDCGIPYEDMNALNKRHDDVRFVWMIHMSHYNFKTDIRGFRATTEHYGIITPETAWNFTYCEDLICLDIGHRAPDDLSFLTEMPQLVYLMINGSFNLYDITPVGTLKNLRWLEMFMCYGVTDLSPLLGCTSLSDLNIIVAGTNNQQANFDVISQMTWLDRLWFSNAQLTVEQEQQLHELNPKLITWRGYGKNDSTGGSWRADLDYYEMRDILFPGADRWYMGPFGGNIPFRVIDGVRYDDVDGEWVALGNDPNEGVDWNAHMA